MLQYQLANSCFQAAIHRRLFDMVRRSLVAEGWLSPLDSDRQVAEVSQRLQVHWWSFTPVKHLLIVDGRLREGAGDDEVRLAIDEWLGCAMALSPSPHAVND